MCLFLGFWEKNIDRVVDFEYLIALFTPAYILRGNSELSSDTSSAVRNRTQVLNHSNNRTWGFRLKKRDAAFGRITM